MALGEKALGILEGYHNMFVRFDPDFVDEAIEEFKKIIEKANRVDELERDAKNDTAEIKKFYNLYEKFLNESHELGQILYENKKYIELGKNLEKLAQVTDEELECFEYQDKEGCHHICGLDELMKWDFEKGEVSNGKHE